MNRETVIEELKKKRTLSEAEGNNIFVEWLSEKQKDIDLCIIYSIQARIAVRMDDGQSIIIWDECYWKYYRKYLMATGSARKMKNSVTQAVTAVMTEHLSERYSAFKDLSDFLSKIAFQYGTSSNLTIEELDKMENRILIAKAFSFFHETAHIRIAQKDIAALRTKDIIFHMFSRVKREQFAPLNQWADLHFQMVQEILSGNYEQILEELMADIYAAGKLAVYLKEIFGYADFALVCEAVVSIGYLSGFQNLFNVITKAWDGHYTEIRFGLHPRTHKINPYINKLETIRTGLGGLMTVILLLSKFELSDQQRLRAWQRHDVEHVNNSDVMECLAAEKFICTAILEARIR